MAKTETTSGGNTGTDKPAAKRSHKATYAKDKKKGGYLVRVIGPNAPDFAGREVPVTRADDSENMEKLDRLVWSGTDDGVPASNGRPEIKGTGKPAALYTFVAKPKDETDEIPF